MSKHDFLLEIGLEELPARFVTSSMEQLKQAVSTWLKEQRLDFAGIEAYSTPRRLAIVIKDLAAGQEDLETESRGPAKKIAVAEDGSWTKAAEGFARGQGITADQLTIKEVKGTEYVFAKSFQKGKQTTALLPEIEHVVTGLHFPKNMRWHDYSLRFARPIQWLIAMYGHEVIPFSITDIETGKETRGHRFLGETVTINEPSQYVEQLREQFVIVDSAERKELIRTQLETLAESKSWVIPVNEDLLEEVNNLVEWPTALSGGFEQSFLTLPREVLLTTMKEHQRYFPVEDLEGELLPYFITVRNGDALHLDNVAKGNEKVLRARFSDSAFFFAEDQKLKIDAAVKQLDSIVYHEDLGSIGEKVKRIQALAEQLANRIGSQNVSLVNRAADICKFDLVTQMVGEFPELQGLMGEVYALHHGEEQEVAQAIKEHYYPRFAGDQLPDTSTGLIVSMADKLDTIVSCFAIGLIPSGSQDPYALRRQALGLVQMMAERSLDLTLHELLELAVDTVQASGLKIKDKASLLVELQEFFALRVKHALTDKGIEYDVIDAVIEGEQGSLPWLFAKAALLSDAKKQDSFKKIVEALSRVTNIARKAETETDIDTALFEKEEEHALYLRYTEAKGLLVESKQNGQPDQAFQVLKDTVSLVDQYFEGIMVMADDENVKANRLQLMKQLAKEIEAFAKFQKIVY